MDDCLSEPKVLASITQHSVDCGCIMLYGKELTAQPFEKHRVELDTALRCIAFDCVCTLTRNENCTDQVTRSRGLLD